MQEEDVGEAGADIEGAEAKYDSNKAYIIDAARVMAATGSATPNLQEGYYVQSWTKRWTCFAKQQPGRARHKFLAT